MATEIGQKLYKLANNSTQEKFESTLWEVILYVLRSEIEKPKVYAEQYMDGEFGAVPNVHMACKNIEAERK